MAILLGISRIFYGNCPAFKVGFKVKKIDLKLGRDPAPPAFW
jgi:hypothetical protein